MDVTAVASAATVWNKAYHQIADGERSILGRPLLAQKVLGE